MMLRRHEISKEYPQHIQDGIPPRLDTEISAKDICEGGEGVR
jgi:hypothetical protein